MTRKMELTKRSTHWSMNLGCVLMCTCTSTPFNSRLWAPAITTSRYSLGPKYRHSSPHAYPSRSCTFIFGTEAKYSVKCRRLTKVCWRRRRLVMWPYTYTMSICLYGLLLASRRSKETTYWYIEDNTPHHAQRRARDMVKRLQLLKNRCLHEQSLWKSKRILGVENTRRLVEDLLVHPKQRRIQRPIPLELYSKRSSSDQSKLIDTVSNLARQRKECAGAYRLASRLMAEIR